MNIPTGRVFRYNLNDVINDINKVVDQFDSVDVETLNFLEKVKKGKDNTLVKYCHDLLKDLLKFVNEIEGMDAYTKAADATERFDSFCTIFPEELKQRYFLPKFNKVYDNLDEIFEKLKTSPITPTPSSGTTTPSVSSGTTTPSVSSGTTTPSVSGISGYGPSSYTGPSIVDYLKSLGKPSDKEFRKKLAEEMGIKDYNFTAEQNTRMLNMLRGTSSTPSGTSNIGSSPSNNQYRSNIPSVKPSQPKPKKSPTSLIAAAPNGESLYFIRMSAGRYRPAVMADLNANIQLYAKNPNPVARIVTPYIRIDSMPIRRANTP
jgi:hypothetical protein